MADEPQIAFGGVKASGYARFGRAAGIAEFTDLQWLAISTSPPHYPFRENGVPDGRPGQAQRATLMS